LDEEKKATVFSGVPPDSFRVLLREFPDLSIIAEDLGIVTPDVREIMLRLAFPGMPVLLFAFGEDNPGPPYLPHNYPRECLVFRKGFSSVFRGSTPSICRGLLLALDFWRFWLCFGWFGPMRVTSLD